MTGAGVVLAIKHLPLSLKMPGCATASNAVEGGMQLLDDTGEFRLDVVEHDRRFSQQIPVVRYGH
ncbi:hypothetical protein ACPA9J_08960 [Pseudomonas aeruginosa]